MQALPDSYTNAQQVETVELNHSARDILENKTEFTHEWTQLGHHRKDSAFDDQHSTLFSVEDLACDYVEMFPRKAATCRKFKVYSTRWSFFLEAI